jgi:Zn-dependent protease
VLVIGFLILSLAIHEVAHAVVALWCGDTTARDLGRITLNPVPHIDPFMTIVLPALLLFMSGGRFAFGGAKPVPVNPANLRHPLRDMALVAIAGPLSNIVLALVFMFALHAAARFGGYEPGMLMYDVLLQTVVLNVVLAVFNMLPIPPLDGSRVMAYLLPAGIRDSYVRLESLGMLLVFGFMATGMFSRIFRATVIPIIDGLDTIVGSVL